jgi:hypothetical protein
MHNDLIDSRFTVYLVSFAPNRFVCSQPFASVQCKHSLNLRIHRYCHAFMRRRREQARTNYKHNVGIGGLDTDAELAAATATVAAAKSTADALVAQRDAASSKRAAASKKRDAEAVPPRTERLKKMREHLAGLTDEFTKQIEEEVSLCFRFACLSRVCSLFLCLH